MRVESKDNKKQGTEEKKEIFNPFSDMDRFRLEAFRRIPGVIRISEHLLRNDQ